MEKLDVYGEGDSGSRSLSPRHISSTEKILPQANNAINNSTAELLCHSYSLQPDFSTYLAALNTYAWVLWTCGFLVLVATFVLFVLSLRSALRHWKQNAVSVAIVLGVYPLVATAGFVAILVPRARLLSEAAAQETVMVAMYHLFCVIIAECGGADQLVRQSAGARLETRVLPCCCWPCCIIPRPKLKKQNVTWLRYLVFQMPVIQGLLYIGILILWSEDMRLYLQCFIYFQPFIVASILSGVWGIIMTVKMAATAGINVRPRFFVLQLVLVILKLQCGIAKMLPELVDFPCLVDLNPSVVANMVQNSVMMIEMLLLSVWAWRLYRVPPGKSLVKAIHIAVAVLDDTKALDVRASKDGVENRSFKS